METNASKLLFAWLIIDVSVSKDALSAKFLSTKIEIEHSYQFT